MKNKLTIFAVILSLLITTFAPSATAYGKTAGKSTEKFANLVVFAYFENEKSADGTKDIADGQAAGSDYFSEQANRDAFIELYNGTNGKEISFSEYMDIISYGQFSVQNVFPQDNGTTIKACKIKGVTMAQAQTGDYDAAIITEALDQVSSTTENLDYDEDGYIDNLTIILKGCTTGEDTSGTTMHPHKSQFADSGFTWNGKRIASYNILTTYGLKDSEFATGSSVIAHEFLHSIGYPDLYTKDTNIPVYTWDIMGSSHSAAYPLAYLRQHFSKWITLPEYTKSTQNITVDIQSNENGNQAAILKSPLNDQEFFVAEFRKDVGNGVDTALSGEGLIVYRIDTTVPYLSNYHYPGEIAVYIFRPSKTKDEYTSDITCIKEAALSKENNRTSIGSADLNAELSDGALTFSDGSNSGVVISNVSSSAGDSMTFDVEIPNAADVDAWENIEFPGTNDSAQKYTALTATDDALHMATRSGKTYTSYQYNGTAWNQTGSFTENNSNYSDTMELFFHNDTLYLAYDYYDTTSTSGLGTFVLKKFVSGTWQTVAVQPNIGANADVLCEGENIYLSATTGNYTAKLFRLNTVDANFDDLGTFFNGGNTSMCGQPKLAEINGKIYLSIRNANTSRVEVYQYNSANSFTNISPDSNTPISAPTYDFEALGGKLHVLAGENSSSNTDTTLMMYTYDTSTGTWTSGESTSIAFSNPILISSQGNLYTIVSTANGTGYTKVYRYDTDNGSFIQEGLNVDKQTLNPSFASSKDSLYISYVSEGDSSTYQVTVRQKTTRDKLLSLSITPPTKTAYLQGESLERDGLIVEANYSETGTRILSESDYTIECFDTTQSPGEYIATISYDDETTYFVYNIQEKIARSNEVYTCAYDSNSSSAGNGTIDSPYNRFQDAVDNVDDGGTIYILNKYNGGSVNGFINSLDEKGLIPFVIDKNVTIKPAPGQASAALVSRASGIILGDDVTFENIQLQFANRWHDAIFANGHSLTLTNVSLTHGHSQVDFFTGGLKTNVAYDEPTAGKEGIITIQINENFNSGDTNTIAMGNIYAGSMNTTFDGKSEIHIKVAENGSSDNLKLNDSTIYACGAKEAPVASMFEVVTGEEPDPPIADPEKYTTNGDVLITLNNKLVKKIDGITGSDATASVEYNNSSPYLMSNIIMSDIDKLDIKSGNLEPAVGSSFTDTAAELSIAKNAQFSLVNFPSEVKLAKYSGGTTDAPVLLSIGQEQQLIIADEATGRSNVGVGGQFNGSSSKIPVEGYRYISVSQPTDDTKDVFTFLDYNYITEYTPLYDGKGSWRAPIVTSTSANVFVKGFSIADTEPVLPTTNTGATIPLTVSYTDDSAENDRDLGLIPLTILVNGESVPPVMDKHGYYSYTHDNTGLYMEIVQDELQIINSDPNTYTIPQGTYDIRIAVPAKYTSEGKNLSQRIDLTVSSDISLATVVLPAGDYYYTGNNIKPKPIVTYGNRLLVNGTDYELYYSSNIYVGTATISIVGIGSYTGEINQTFNIVIKDSEKLKYKVHVQSDGWQGIRKDGETSGTSGKALRLEGIKIKLGNHITDNYEGNILYQTHIQSIGWEKDWRKNWEVSGTSGKALRLEAIRIKLEGKVAEHYDVYYRVHAQTFGWLGWAKNGENAGTAGYAYRLEAIEICLVEKGGDAPDGNERPFVEKGAIYGDVAYQVHVQADGWQGIRTDGKTAGTLGRALRLEGINIKLGENITAQHTGDIIYQTHIQSIGWEKDWKKNWEMSGTSGKALRLEAIRINLGGDVASHYDVYYRVHAQQFGWLGWAKNGEDAGTAGYSYRLEAIQIYLIPKGTNFSTDESPAFKLK